MNLNSLNFGKDIVSFIHQKSLDVLSISGCEFDHPESLEIFKKHGFRVEGNLVYFSEDQIDQAIKSLPKSFELNKVDGSKYRIGEGSKTMATSGSPPYILDQKNKIRFALMDDFVDICKVVHTSDAIDMTHLLLCDTYDVPRENRSDKMLAALLRYTTLPISLTALASNEDDSGIVAKRLVETIQRFYGNDREYVTVGCVSPISPLAYVRDALDSLFVYCELGQPIQLATCSLPVLTSPASIMGTLIQNNAELLAGIVLIELIKPGLPVIYGNTSTSTNLKNISMALGSSESALIASATSAMAKFYDMPCRASGALNDAVDIDFQAGVESAITLMSGVLSDVDLMFFSCGMLSGFNITSLEKYIVDEQLIKMVRRFNEGIHWDMEKDYVQEIVKAGPRGSFLRGRTPKDYRNEHFVPEVFVKTDCNTWQTDDAKTIKEKATTVVAKRIKEYVAPEFDKEQIAIISKYL